MKGQDATVDMATTLARHGYSVAPHISAQQVRDRAHLADLVAQCRAAGVTDLFVVGGDPSDTPTAFGTHENCSKRSTSATTGSPTSASLGTPKATQRWGRSTLPGTQGQGCHGHHIKTQIVFDPKVILAWSRELDRRGITLPIRVGVPGAVTRQKLLRVSSGLGLGASADFLKKQQGMFWRFFLPGGYSPDRIVSGLGPHLGSPDNHLDGFHVFSFNDLESTIAGNSALFSTCPEAIAQVAPPSLRFQFKTRPGPRSAGAPHPRRLTSARTNGRPLTSSTSTLPPAPAPHAADLADHARLVIQSPDRPGIVSAISTFLTDAGANIVALDQFSTAHEHGAFFQRTEFHLPGLSAARSELEHAFGSSVADVRHAVHFPRAARLKRVAILVSKTDHCLLDLLWRNRRGELGCRSPW